MLTQSQLKDELDYDHETGIFKYKVTRRKSIAGKIAGSYSNKYIQISTTKGTFFAHRLAWLYVYGEWPKYQIDHINGICDDNRICNLRDVTASINQKNRYSLKRCA